VIVPSDLCWFGIPDLMLSRSDCYVHSNHKLKMEIPHICIVAQLYEAAQVCLPIVSSEGQINYSVYLLCSYWVCWHNVPVFQLICTDNIMQQSTNSRVIVHRLLNLYYKITSLCFSLSLEFVIRCVNNICFKTRAWHILYNIIFQCRHLFKLPMGYAWAWVKGAYSYCVNSTS
jgi:hypothetical protein